MSDTDQQGNRETAEHRPVSRRLRWRIIPGTFMTLFAVMSLIGAAVQAAITVYYNMTYGWIQVDPSRDSLNQLAITPINILVWQCVCWGALAAGGSAFAWFRGRWRFAWGLTVMFFGLMLTGKWLESF